MHPVDVIDITKNSHTNSSTLCFLPRNVTRIRRSWSGLSLNRYDVHVDKVVVWCKKLSFGKNYKVCRNILGNIIISMHCYVPHVPVIH